MKKSFSLRIFLILTFVNSNVGHTETSKNPTERHNRKEERKEMALKNVAKATRSVEVPIQPLAMNEKFQLSKTSDHEALAALLEKEELRKFLSLNSEDLDGTHSLAIIEKDENNVTHFTQLLPLGLNGKIDGYCDFLKAQVRQGSEVDLALRAGEIQFGMMSEFKISTKGDQKLEQKLKEDPNFKKNFESARAKVYDEFKKVDGSSFLVRLAQDIFRKKSEREDLKSEAEVVVVRGILESLNQTTILSPPLEKETPAQLGMRYKASRKACFPNEIPYGLVSL